MWKYFKQMKPFGKELTEKQRQKAADDIANIKKVEKEVLEALEKAKNAGSPDEQVYKRGEKTAFERINYICDEFIPLNSLYDPAFNQYGSTGVINGLAKISGKWVSLIASNNKVVAGAWIPGQSENIFRAQDIAETLRIPLVWILNCSGVSLAEQEEVYAGRRSGGRTFFRHAELIQKGIPVIVGVYGTNPAGGGYHAISPATIFAHKNANMAVGGGGIVSGMAPKGNFDIQGAEQLIEATKKFKAVPPGSTKIHHDQTGFFKKVFDTEEGVLDAIKDYLAKYPSYNPEIFRVDTPKEPKFSQDDLNYLIPFNQKMVYNMDEVLSRLFDGSEHLEFKPSYGPEVYCGIAKMNGLPVGVIANRQGFLGAKYPEYANGQYIGIGGKIYRQGLIKMNEFVTLCGRDRMPVIWLQDTSGIDVGDIAEQAELLGIGQSLIYSIESSQVPMMCVVVRKGSAAAHYIMGGPQGNRNNAFTIGVPTTEIYVMHGETASTATFARRLVKDKEAGKDLQPTIDKMNALAKEYYAKSRPIYCAQKGFIDEIVSFDKVRKYLTTFAEAAYQNPTSVCPHHQMLTPRVIVG